MGKSGRRAISAAVLLAVYFVAGKLGLMLAFLHPSATAVWPNSGIALAALLILGADAWPVVFVGALLVNLTTYGSFATSAGIAVGNTLEALIGAWLVRRFARGENAVFQTSDIFKFTILAGMVSTAVSATIGVTGLALGGFASWANYWAVWLTWWLGDAVGDVVVAPLLLIWASRRGNPWKWSQVRPEAVLLLVLVILSGQIVFNGILPKSHDYRLEYLCMPLLAWAAVRFGQREAAVTVLLFSASALWGTVSGYGPFTRSSLNESLLLLQSFLGVSALMTLVLSAEIAERQRAEKEARSLAAIDALTGLGNQRKLFDAIEREISRSERSGRPFVILMLDLDGLKKINDTHGHLVGNRALCRLADILRLECRTSDTTARFGGDEFTIILAESDRETAESVVRRIQTSLLLDTEHPTLSVSIGLAMWPDNGKSIEDLMRYADDALYEMKRYRSGKSLPPLPSNQRSNT